MRHDHEKNVSAQSKQAHKNPRLSQPDEDHRRPGHNKAPAGQGQEEAIGIGDWLEAPSRSPRDGEMSQKFRPEMRIRRGPDFKAALRRGEKRRSRYFILYSLPDTGGLTRIGVITSRKVGNAVERNRARRIIREIFRRNRDSMPAGLDYVVIASRSMVGAEHGEIEKALLGALRSSAG